MDHEQGNDKRNKRSRTIHDEESFSSDPASHGDGPGRSSSDPFKNPVDPTGIWSTIIIDDALWDEVTLTAGDEIGVFDGDLCVGAIEITADQSWPASVNAVGEDAANVLPGYTDNNPMSFKLWNNTDELERTAIVSYSRG